MKKKCCVLCLMLACMVLTTACTSNAGDEFSYLLQDRWGMIHDAPDPNAPAPVPVEIVPYENGDFAPDLGFDLVSYPSHENLMVQRFYALDGWFGQLEYEAADGLAPVLRVAQADGEDLHSTYANLSPTAGLERTVGDIEVRVHHMDDTTVMAYWLRGDFQYLVHLNRSQDEIVDPVIEEFVNTVDSRSV